MSNLYLCIFLSLGFIGVKPDVQNIQTANFEFVAMEYIGMSNHIYKVIVTDTQIIGLEVNGYISVANITNTGTAVNRDDLQNPEAYIDTQMTEKYDNIDIANADLLSMNSRNFRIKRSDIASVKLSKKKKFGMGYYPYSGRIILKSARTIENSKRKRDLILIGDQEEQVIINILKTTMDNK